MVVGDKLHNMFRTKSPHRSKYHYKQIVQAQMCNNTGPNTAEKEEVREEAKEVEVRVL